MHSPAFRLSAPSVPARCSTHDLQENKGLTGLHLSDVTNYTTERAIFPTEFSFPSFSLSFCLCQTWDLVFFGGWMNEWMNGRVAWSRFPEAAAHLVHCTMPYHFVPYPRGPFFPCNGMALPSSSSSFLLNPGGEWLSTKGGAASFWDLDRLFFCSHPLRLAWVADLREHLARGCIKTSWFSEREKNIQLTLYINYPGHGRLFAVLRLDSPNNTEFSS